MIFNTYFLISIFMADFPTQDPHGILTDMEEN